MLFYDDLTEFVEKENAKLQRLKSANIPEMGVVLEVLGPNDDQGRETNDGKYSITQSVERLAIDHLGIVGDRHRRLSRRATGRETPLYKQSGVEIANRRQILVVSLADCEELSRRLNVEVTPALLGANLVIGREDGGEYSLSVAPLNTYLAIAPAKSLDLPRPPIATLVKYVQQKGCTRTGHAIAQAYADNALTQKFLSNAEDHRGIVCSVEYPVDSLAYIERGQKVFFKFPMGRCN